MGTLYDLLGALPGDDAEGLRTAFRKAAKATHPDINPDNPDAALHFRELVRAYDILTDTEQRATYDQLLAIALLPPPATPTPATRTYEVVGKYASNTMAATIISAVLVGGYTLFGLFSKPPSAAEIEFENIPGATLRAFAAALPVLPKPAETLNQREGEVSADGPGATPAAAAVTREAAPAPIGRFEPVPPFATYNLAVQYQPRFATTYFDRGNFFDRVIFLHGAAVPDRLVPDRPLTDRSPVKRAADSKKIRNAGPASRKPLSIVPPPALAPVPDRWTPITPALTPG
jgi:curved DNA-binding protein CbpA